MIRYKKQDITEVTYGIICHGVNCQGVMGSGVAKAIKEKWPEVYETFINNGSGAELLGTISLTKPTGFPKLAVYNCYTQEYYGRDGRAYASTEAIRDALYMVCNIAAITGEIVHIPKIGCGLGGLSWGEDVEPIIKSLADSREVTVWVYEI